MKLGLAVVRAVMGLLMFGHGAQKLFGWFGGHGLQGTAGFFDQVGLKPGKRTALAAGAGEAGGGALLALGFLTPLASAAIIGVMSQAIRTVHAGRRYLPAAIASKMAEHALQPELTRREREVLRWMARGKSNKEIGVALCISEGTVKTHVKAILAKLGAVSRTEAVMIAAERGLVKL